MHVQFSADGKEIISVFAGLHPGVPPQDPDVYPNQGEVEEDDPRYVKFMALVEKVGQ